MELSNFARRFTAETGIGQLMDDLGEAMAGAQDTLMLGGGNPAHIPEVQALLSRRLHWLADHPREINHAIGNYDSPRGKLQFIRVLADFFRTHYGWDIGPENIVLTSGSQSGFFLLFNSLAGAFADGSNKRILLPMVPEYIGYSNVGLAENMFTANRPAIETFADRSFKYHVAFDELQVDETIGAICISRPTNPTGNVVSDQAIAHLHDIAAGNGIPLVIDNAYGMPFPNIIFTKASLVWSEHIILCMSLSKLGLPGVRTGIIIAREEITAAIARMNGIISLALGSFGPALVLDLIRSGDVIALCRDVIRPYYQAKAGRVIELIRREMDGVEYYLHKSEGAIFVWLWFPGLPISNAELYRRLKDRGVLIISGHHFFPGLEEDWQHKHECIRVSYAMHEDVVREGIRVIAQEVKRLSR